MEEKDKEIVVEIRQRGIVIDPGITFTCESAQPYHDERKVVIRGVRQLATLQGKSLLVGLFIEDGQLVVTFQPGEKYIVIINGQECVFSRIIKK